MSKETAPGSWMGKDKHGFANFVDTVPTGAFSKGEAQKKQVASNPYAALEDDAAGDSSTLGPQDTKLASHEIPAVQTGVPIVGTKGLRSYGAGQGTQYEGMEGNVALSYTSVEKEDAGQVGVASTHYEHSSQYAQEGGKLVDEEGIVEGDVVTGAGVG